MNKILTLIIFASLFVSINAYSIESGHQIKDSEGNKMYFSLKQNRYVYCKDFVLEGSVITIEGYTIATALVCDENDLSLSNLEGVKTFDSSKYDKYIVDNNNLDFTDAIPINSNGKLANLKVQELVFGYELRLKKEDEYSEFVSDEVWKWDGKKFLEFSDWRNRYSNSRKVDFSKLEGIWQATCIDVDTEETFRCPKDVVKEFFIDEQSIFSSLEKFFEPSKTTVSAKKSRDVKGKKLWCTWNGDDVLGFGFEFNKNDKVKLKGIDDDNEKLITINGKYQALSNKIIIKYKNLDNSDEEITISRKTLKINGSSSSSCKPINKSSSIDNKLKRALDKLISEKSSDNKF